MADIEGQIHSYSIQRLNEGSEYMFRVIAANPIGSSEALESETIVVKSQFGKFPLTPASVQTFKFRCLQSPQRRLVDPSTSLA